MRKLIVAVCCSLLALTAGELDAQIDVGGQLSYADDFDFGVGARGILGLPAVTPGLEVIGTFDFFFPENVDYWEVNGNVAYAFPLETASVVPYVGGGLNVAHASVDVSGVGSASNTEIGFNLLGGAKFPLQNITPFGEIRLELSGGEQLVISGGVTFNVSPPAAARTR